MSHQTADVIAYNGKIATQNEQRSMVEAVAIRDGKFLAAGTAREMMAWRGDQTQLINLNKRTAIPGLSDSHTHLIPVGSTTISNFAGMACRRSRTVCECCETRLGEPHPDNESGWWAAGLSFNSPSGACRRWTS
jgi:predicted amidohydrolase YtcJ